MGRPSTVCSEVPSTSRTMTESDGGDNDEPPPHYVAYDTTVASTSKPTLAATEATAPLADIAIIMPAANNATSATRHTNISAATRRAVTTIDSSFENSDESEESYQSSDEEPNNQQRTTTEFRLPYDGPPRHDPPPAFYIEYRNDMGQNVTVAGADRGHETSANLVSGSNIGGRDSMSSGGGGGGSSGSDSSNNNGGCCYGRRTFCFGLLMIHSTFFTLFIFDLLLLSYSLVFTVTNYLNGPTNYNKINLLATSSSLVISTLSPSESSVLTVGESTFATITEIPYDTLLPLFAVQVFWLVSGLAAVITLKLVQPLLQLPYMLISLLLMFAALWLIARCIVRFFNGAAVAIDWILVVTAVLSTVVFIVQFYYLYVKLICLRALLRKRNTVVSSISSTISTTEAQSSGAHAVTGGSGYNPGGTVSRPSSASAFAAAIEARIFRNRQRRPDASEGNSGKEQKRRDKCYNKTITTSSHEKSSIYPYKKAIDADCCSCASCCCDETYSTKSTVIITDDYEEIRRHKH